VGAKVFTKIDLKGGFHQFNVEPSDQEKTAFSWQGQQYVFQGAPFGFKHLPSIFQKVMSTYFKSCPFVRVYIDDIIIHSPTFSEHILHVRQVIHMLNAANLRLNPEKCEWAKLFIVALGYLVGQGGIQVAPQKLVAIDSWQEPTTGHTIEKHLGFFNFFRELIPNYSSLTAPLERLRHVKTFQWTEEYRAIYSKRKAILSSTTVLSYPDFSKPFLVGTDASNRELVVCFINKTVNKPDTYLLRQELSMILKKDTRQPKENS
jgi:hypothetical protein